MGVWTVGAGQSRRATCSLGLDGHGEKGTESKKGPEGGPLVWEEQTLTCSHRALLSLLLF